MTPLARKFAPLFDDADQWHFIDIGEFPERTEARDVDVDIILHPPFRRTVFLASDIKGGATALRLESGEDSIAFAGIGMTANGDRKIFQPVAFVRSGKGVKAVLPEGASANREGLEWALRLVSACFDALPEALEAYVPTPKRSFVNAKRKKKKKPPLLYDWVTVEIKPALPKSAPKGGTHSSPRMHDRRGHWRHLGERRVWVRECRVGDPCRGARFKDYRVSLQR